MIDFSVLDQQSPFICWCPLQSHSRLFKQKNSQGKDNLKASLTSLALKWDSRLVVIVIFWEIQWLSKEITQVQQYTSIAINDILGAPKKTCLPFSLLVVLKIQKQVPVPINQKGAKEDWFEF